MIDNSFKPEGVPMRRFWLNRVKDQTGVSRTGRVLEGVVCRDGQVIIQWRPPLTSVAIYKDWKTFMTIHVDCHPSCNEVVWLDDAPGESAAEAESRAKKEGEPLYFCNKCGYIGVGGPEHPGKGCNYNACLIPKSPQRGCLLASPGRGDCVHAVGLPTAETYPVTVDEYGRPHGWCEVCWRGELVIRAHQTIRKHQDALIWCSSSEDFQEGGKARQGWLNLCDPLLPRAPSAKVKVTGSA